MLTISFLSGLSAMPLAGAFKRFRHVGFEQEGGARAAGVSSSMEHNEDLLYEILKRLDARSLAFASCVNRRWRKAADIIMLAIVAGTHKRFQHNLDSEQGERRAAGRSFSMEHDEDLLHEILKHLDARPLAFASCVSRRWRKAAGIIMLAKVAGAHKRCRHYLDSEQERGAGRVARRSFSMEHNEDVLYEILKHLDARSLAAASCVSRRWRKAAEDETLWEGICSIHTWTAAAFPRLQHIKSVIVALGGFRRLYILYLRPLLLQRPRQDMEERWSKNEVDLSLSLFSIDCYERLGRHGSLGCLPFVEDASAFCASFPQGASK